MAYFHFFTDIDALSEQSSSFGPFDDSNDTSFDTYRLTSMHESSNSITKAYAIADGEIIIQQVSGIGNEHLINLILRPSVTFPQTIGKIKYIIYKGLIKESLVDELETPFQIASASNNDLTYDIWSSRNVKNQEIDNRDGLPPGTTNLPALASSIGYDFSILNGFDDEIEVEFLFEQLGTNKSIVKSGWHIGNFNNSSFGMEIIIENIGFPFKLKSARVFENILKVSKLDGTESNYEKFVHWHKKEEIHNYLDICTFYGSFYSDFSLLKYTISNASIIQNLSSKNEVYEKILEKFNNKNRVYLDIKGEHNHSLNYYLNYDSIGQATLKLGFGNQNYMDMNYYHNKWPILILNNDDFSDTQTNSSEKNILHLLMPKGDNFNGILFLSIGFFNNTSEEEFPTEILDRDKFHEFTESIDYFNFFNPIQVVLPNYNSQNEVQLISNYLKISIFKKIPNSDLLSGLSIGSEFNLDNIFVANFLKAQDVQPNNGVNIKVYQNEVFSDQSSLILSGKIGIAKDKTSLIELENTIIKKNITFFLIPKCKKDNGSVGTYYLSELNDGKFDNYNTFSDFLISKLPGISKTVNQLFLSSTNVFYSNFHPIPNDIESNDKIRGLIMLTLDENSFINLNNQIANNFITKLNHEIEPKVFIGLKNKEIRFDVNNKMYSEFDLVLRGLKEQNGDVLTNEIYVVDSNNINIKVYQVL
jgi:hypothetical protein